MWCKLRTRHNWEYMVRRSNPIETIADNESFVALIQLCVEDSVARQDILHILEMTPEKRNSAMREVIANMRKNKISKDVVDAFSFLINDDVAKKVLVYLNSHLK